MKVFGKYAPNCKVYCFLFHFLLLSCTAPVSVPLTFLCRLSLSILHIYFNSLLGLLQLQELQLLSLLIYACLFCSDEFIKSNESLPLVYAL